MASGKITVTNNTQNDVWYNITQDGNTNVILASGTLPSRKSLTNTVSGYLAYQVNFAPVTSGTISASGVPNNGQIIFSVSSDRAIVAEE